jgi:hypothetical protein
MTTTSSPSEPYTASDWTQQSMLGDLMQQKWLLVGAGVVIAGLWLVSRRSQSQEHAARRLVRDWTKVDDPDDARNLLGENVPVIMRPVLLSALEELERLVHRWFAHLEREIERL